MVRESFVFLLAHVGFDEFEHLEIFEELSSVLGQLVAPSFADQKVLFHEREQFVTEFLVCDRYSVAEPPCEVVLDLLASPTDLEFVVLKDHEENAEFEHETISP